MTLDVQFMTMISMIIGGIYLGIVVETFRRFSIHWKHRSFLKYFMEVSFWLLQTLLLYYLLFRVNSGELRFYVFAACLLGFAMYKVLLENIYKNVLEYMIRVCLATYRFLKRLFYILIIAPIVFVFHLLVSIIVFVANMALLISIFTGKVIFSPVLWLIRLIYNILPKNVQQNLHKIAGFYSTMKNIIKKWLEYIMFTRR